MTAPDQFGSAASKNFLQGGGAFSNRVSLVNGSLIASPLSMVLSPPRVTVLSAVGIIRRNIWSEAQALQCPQRAGVQ
jgi:hypothetical protein